MSIVVEHNASNISAKVLFPSLNVVQNLTNEVDTCEFHVRRLDGTSFIPAFNDDIKIKDGNTIIFAGKVVEVQHDYGSLGQAAVKVLCVDHSFEMDRILVQQTYTNMAVSGIIQNIVSSYAPGFTANSVQSDFVIKRIVFNQVPISQCLRKLADLVSCDWYVDEDKDVHFFPKETNLAPFDLTDTAGKYVHRSLVRSQDGSQLVNRVKVRGGEYDGATYTDKITVSGNNTKSFNLPYKFANLTVKVNDVAKTVGIDFIDDFSNKNVLYNFQTQSIRFENPLNDGDVVEFSGNPKTPVLAIAEDADSIVKYGAIEKLIRDTSIASNTIARKRAAAELLAFADVAVDARFTTYTARLRAGMLLNISSDLRNLNDQLIIKRIVFTARTPDEFEYEVQCISTKRYELLDVLRKILTPEPMADDEKEVSEQLFAVNEQIQADDQAEFVAPFLYDEEVQSQADNFIDAVDPNDVIWVYGYYAPLGVTDTKRMGKYARDAKYQ